MNGKLVPVDFLSLVLRALLNVALLKARNIVLIFDRAAIPSRFAFTGVHFLFFSVPAVDRDLDLLPSLNVALDREREEVSLLRRPLAVMNRKSAAALRVYVVVKSVPIDPPPRIILFGEFRDDRDGRLFIRNLGVFLIERLTGVRAWAAGRYAS